MTAFAQATVACGSRELLSRPTCVNIPPQAAWMVHRAREHSSERRRRDALGTPRALG